MARLAESCRRPHPFARNGETGHFDSTRAGCGPSLAGPDEVWVCDTCATMSSHNIRGVCPRNRCPGILSRANQERLGENHYRILYESADLPPALSAEEHTAQIDSDEARQRQDKFKNGRHPSS